MIIDWAMVFFASTGFFIGSVTFSIIYKYESGKFEGREAYYKLLVSEAEERETKAKIELYKFESLVKESLEGFKEVMNRK